MKKNKVKSCNCETCAYINKSLDDAPCNVCVDESMYASLEKEGIAE